MKKKTIIIIVAVAAITGYNAFKMYETEQLSSLGLMNLEALANMEYDSPCIEWATKPCHDDFLQHINDPNAFHATCSGTPSVVGGKLECGAVTGRRPLYPYENKQCLECVRTSSGGEAG